MRRHGGQNLHRLLMSNMLWISWLADKPEQIHHPGWLARRYPRECRTAPCSSNVAICRASVIDIQEKPDLYVQVDYRQNSLRPKLLVNECKRCSTSSGFTQPFWRSMRVSSIFVTIKYKCEYDTNTNSKSPQIFCQTRSSFFRERSSQHRLCRGTECRSHVRYRC